MEPDNTWRGTVCEWTVLIMTFAPVSAVILTGLIMSLCN